MIGQFTLLTILAATAGLGALGWVVGVAYGLFVCAALTHALGTEAFGPANTVTLTRATLVGGVTALVANSFGQPAALAPLVGITIVALVLDWVDGQVARRTRTVSVIGARFDMEVDAFLILVLSVYVAHWAGPWVLAIGGMRYAYVAAMWLLPWLRGPLRPRYWRKVVAAVQGVVLLFATADILPRPLEVAALIAALLLLTESFGRDVVYLYRTRRDVAPTGRAALIQQRKRDQASEPAPVRQYGA